MKRVKRRLQSHGSEMFLFFMWLVADIESLDREEAMSYVEAIDYHAARIRVLVAARYKKEEDWDVSDTSTSL